MVGLLFSTSPSIRRKCKQRLESSCGFFLSAGILGTPPNLSLLKVPVRDLRTCDGTSNLRFPSQFHGLLELTPPDSPPPFGWPLLRFRALPVCPNLAPPPGGDPSQLPDSTLTGNSSIKNPCQLPFPSEKKPVGVIPSQGGGVGANERLPVYLASKKYLNRTKESEGHFQEGAKFRQTSKGGGAGDTEDTELIECVQGWHGTLSSLFDPNAQGIRFGATLAFRGCLAIFAWFVF